MLTHPFNPRAEKTPSTMLSVSFANAGSRSAQPMPSLISVMPSNVQTKSTPSCEKCQLDPQSDLALVNITLQLLLAIARQELARVQDETLEEIGHRIADRRTSARFLSYDRFSRWHDSLVSAV